MELKGSFDLGKIVDMAADISKTTANLSGNMKPPKEKQAQESTTNQQHQQNVEVHVGEQKENPKPVFIERKPEFHIHKEFPDERALTKDECDLAMSKSRMMMEKDEKERLWQEKKYLMDRQDRKEREEYERRERIRKEEEQKRRRKNRNILAGVVGAISVGLIGYGFYCDFRDRKAGGNLALPKAGDTGMIPGEGDVK